MSEAREFNKFTGSVQEGTNFKSGYCTVVGVYGKECMIIEPTLEGVVQTAKDKFNVVCDLRLIQEVGVTLRTNVEELRDEYYM